MGYTTLFVIAMSFSDFDQCWDFWHDHNGDLTTVEMHQLCQPYDMPIRPRARPVRGDDK